MYTEQYGEFTHMHICTFAHMGITAARLILGSGKFSHISPALYELHWLPVSLRIDYKILNVFMT